MLPRTKQDTYPTDGIGVAVSSSGRKFSSYARALDPNNAAYTVAELIDENSEVPFPSADFNSPPGGPINYAVSPAVGASDHDHLIGAQSVVVDPLDRLWIIDTGRAITDNFTVVPASVVSFSRIYSLIPAKITNCHDIARCRAVPSLSVLT